MVRIAFLVAIPEIYYGADSNSYFEAAWKLWTQGEFVLKGLAPAKGIAAVLSVSDLLDRLDALETSPERKATRKTDRAALDTLAKRGIDAKERARLRALVVASKVFRDQVPVDATAAKAPCVVPAQVRVGAVAARLPLVETIRKPDRRGVVAPDRRRGFEQEPQEAFHSRPTTGTASRIAGFGTTGIT